MTQSKMDEVIRTLEWDRFLDLAQKEVCTQSAAELLLRFKNPGSWAQDTSAAHQMQQETQEVTSLLDREALWSPLTDLTDPAEALDRLTRGGVLEISDFAGIRRWLYAIDSWVHVPREEIRGELFKKTLAMLHDPTEPLRFLERILTPDGELSERASPKLSSLYAEIRSLKKEIENTLDYLVKTLSSKGILQEKFSDVRDGRFVIPIKISSQNEIDGIIYEASASRQTVFVEPKEVAPLNNRLRQRQNDLLQEIYRILEETSKSIAPFAAEISAGVSTLVYWDAIHAKARLGRKYSGKNIQITEDRHFQMKQTAHPLLWWSLPVESIIRNDVDFGAPARTLLLTGPNTGGKTVLLKTLGLAALCARTGFLFPATHQPVVPFFDSIFADLGDSQSIEHHLSSFSGHILKFKEVLDTATSRSLILIDELNSATDPEEGAAFGRAVLETLMSGSRGAIEYSAMIVTTTHDPHLKALAISDARILNASMTFDESTRMPTYRILIGVPGRSRALETAARLGISQDVIELAKSYLSPQHQEFEKMLAGLESDSREAAHARKEATRIREEAEALKKEWTDRTQKTVQEMMDKTRLKLRRILEQAQDEVRSSVKRLDEMRTRREIDQTRNTLKDSFSTAASQIENALHEEAPELSILLDQTQPKQSTPIEEGPQLKVGGQVRVPKWKSTGTVLEITGSKIKVGMGKIQMTLSTSDVEPLVTPRTPAPDSSFSASFSGKREVHVVAAPPSQLDLRGLRFDDAMSELERYLDQAFRSQAYKEVTIVHGLGSGALREGTLKLLGGLPYVKTYRNGGTGQGGAGATIVEFDF